MDCIAVGVVVPVKRSVAAPLHNPHPFNSKYFEKIVNLRSRTSIFMHSLYQRFNISPLCFGAAQALLRIPCVPFLLIPDYILIFIPRPYTPRSLHHPIHIALHCLLVEPIES
jgi:hypothetical protein